MQTYCINREQFDYVLDVTKFKSKAGWAEDPMKEVPTKVKSAFTRTFNQQGLVPRTNTMVEDAKVGIVLGTFRIACDVPFFCIVVLRRLEENVQPPGPGA